MNLDKFLAEVTADRPAPFRAIQWEVGSPDTDRLLECLRLVLTDDRGRQLVIHIGGGVVRPADDGKHARPVSSLASFEFADDVAAVLGCELILWNPESADPNQGG